MKFALIGVALLLALTGCGSRERDEENARKLTGGEPSRGKVAIERYGCGVCHTIPGIGNADGLVGPPLTNIADRMYLAGQLTNNPEHMKKWIRDPQGVEKGTAMPNLNVSEADARDIAAYLYTLRATR